MEKVVTEWLEYMRDTNEEYEKKFDSFQKRDQLIKYISDQPRETFDYVKKWIKLNRSQNKNYNYMITFTMDPKKVDINDKDKVDKIEKFIVSQMNRQGLGIINAEYVREGGDSDHKHIHWHVNIISNKFLRKRYFKTYTKNYGNIDISTSKNKFGSENSNYQSIHSYISKDTVPIQILPKKSSIEC